jgi:hypothetical protein
MRFLDGLQGVLSDYSEVRTELAFKLLDVDSDGRLSLLNLLQINHHLGESGRRSPFSAELTRLYREYKDRNLHMRDGYKYQMQLNLNTYQKLVVPQSCIVDELRLRVFGAIPTA